MPNLFSPLPRSSASTVAQPGERAYTGRMMGLGLAALLLLLVGLISAGHYWFGEQEIERDVRTLARGADKIFTEQLGNDTRLLDTLIDAAKADRCMNEAFTARDRDRLLACAEPIFAAERGRSRITHFYFHTPDKHVFLRAHLPERHGDLIERFTLDEAARTGKNSHGIEGGNVGVLTLRVVHPWHRNGQLLGYVEMGMEIDHYTRLLKDMLDADLLVVIHKQFASRAKWETGLRLSGRQEDWDEYPNCVVIDRTTRLWLPGIDRFSLGEDQPREPAEPPHVWKEAGGYLVAGIPIVDAGKRNVGNLVVVTDARSRHADLRGSTLKLAATGGLLAVLVLAGFRGYARWMRRALARARKEREDLATARHEWAAEEHKLVRELQQGQRSLLEERLLAELQRLAMEPTSVEDFLQTALTRLLDRIDWLPHLPEGVVFLNRRQEGREVLELVAEYNLSPQLVSRCGRVPFGHCLCGRVAVSREVLYVAEVDERHDTHFDGMVAHGHYVVPLLRGDALEGVFTLYLPHGSTHDARDENFLLRVAETLVSGIVLRRAARAASGGNSDERRMP